MDKILRCVGVCQDKNLGLFQTISLPPVGHTYLYQGVSMGPCVWWQKQPFGAAFFFFFLAKASVCAQEFRRVEQGVEERYQDP